MRRGRSKAPKPSAEDRAIAEDLRFLALLHDRELTDTLVRRLRELPFQKCLRRRAGADTVVDLSRRIDQALARLPTPIDQAVLDDLAADYAAIYLTHAFGTSPCASVWLDDDGLARQQPMFAIRSFYRRYALEMDHWHVRSDDHLVPVLQFLAHLHDLGNHRAHMDAVQFLDRHVLTWIDDFADRIGQRSRSPFYVPLIALTAAYLAEIRERLFEKTGIPRPTAIDEETGAIEPALPDGCRIADRQGRRAAPSPR